jgi:hypothetical protein
MGRPNGVNPKGLNPKNNGPLIETQSLSGSRQTGKRSFISVTEAFEEKEGRTKGKRRQRKSIYSFRQGFSQRVNGMGMAIVYLIRLRQVVGLTRNRAKWRPPSVWKRLSFFVSELLLFPFLCVIWRWILRTIGLIWLFIWWLTTFTQTVLEKWLVLSDSLHVWLFKVHPG